MDALDAGRDVMVFSDNVPVDQEVALKRTAAERGLLVMGPDCGTAVVGGVGLGFANVTTPRPGRHRRRLRHRLPAAALRCSTTPASASAPRSASAAATCPPRSAALSTREALRRLDADPAVELIVLVSKPPAAEVAAEIARVRRRRWPPRSSSRCSGPASPT